MSKIQLSAEEMQLVQNGEWILTKHRIIEKVYQLFGAVSVEIQAHLENTKGLLPPEALQLPPKISKGEQYEALPYVVLDYPRFFSKEDVFAVRSFFWWGNYFSITLHLKGKFHQQFYQKIIAALAEKKLNGYYCSCSGNEFNFNLEGKNYFPLQHASARLHAGMETGPFLKISCKIPFAHWNTAEQKLLEAFRHLATITGS
ncbi:MAG: hypothetical protein ABIU63_12745 [Chitinophagaceae bacterium]